MGKGGKKRKVRQPIHESMAIGVGKNAATSKSLADSMEEEEEVQSVPDCIAVSSTVGAGVDDIRGSSADVILGQKAKGTLNRRVYQKDSQDQTNTSSSKQSSVGSRQYESHEDDDDESSFVGREDRKVVHQAAGSLVGTWRTMGENAMHRQDKEDLIEYTMELTERYEQVMEALQKYRGAYVKKDAQYKVMKVERDAMANKTLDIDIGEYRSVKSLARTKYFKRVKFQTEEQLNEYLSESSLGNKIMNDLRIPIYERALFWSKYKSAAMDGLNERRNAVNNELRAFFLSKWQRC